MRSWLYGLLITIYAKHWLFKPSKEPNLLNLCASATRSVAEMRICPIFNMHKVNSPAEIAVIDPESLKLSSSKVGPLSTKLHKAKSNVRYLRFVNSMPFEWATTASKLPGKSIQVALAIWDLASLSKSTRIRLTSKQLGTFSVGRHSAYRALKQLENAGLILVDRKVGRAPLVTICDRFIPSNSFSGSK